ncbi:hypothetical protein BCR35DRAFT_350410 [Leucosporidium creatinivorum]|uniref:Uncharacterized protein n=1 Tax=Leucosporidium creatinivorum TaxID=106004 RepID=A0A1Y2G121_9BASI|nr:hypothetical protein BCR35DRAFT_350410 [Leucosporidium creatinivorum]
MQKRRCAGCARRPKHCRCPPPPPPPDRSPSLPAFKSSAPSHEDDCKPPLAPEAPASPPPTVNQAAPVTTFQVECDLAQLAEDVKDDDLSRLLAAELPLCPSSAPSAIAITSMPCLSFDPDDQYRLSEFSSFAPPTLSTPQLKRRRANKEARLQEVAKKARSSAAVMASAPFSVAVESLPTHPRAGLAGVELKIKEEPLKPRVAATSPTSPPSSSPNPLPPAPQTPARRLSAPELSIAFSIPSSLFYSTPSRPRPKPQTPSPPSLSPAPPPTPPSPSPVSSADIEQQRRALVEARLIKNHPQLEGFTFAHRSGVAGQSTTFVDASRRAFATRVECPDGMLGVADELEREVLASSVRPMKTDGSRGAHQIRQIGVHRENGAVEPVYSSAFTTAPAKWLQLMRGKAFSRFRGHVSRTLQTHYPGVYEYHRSLATNLLARGLHFLFGAFCSFCLNTGGKVATLPHRDKHNLGPGLCGIVPFGDFDSSRSGWLVLEEARLCIEVAAGDVSLFPSAIFTHWNTSIHDDDTRNSLAFWCGASLFLWSELGGRSLSHLDGEERKKVFRENKAQWSKAWERFPIL